MYPPTPTVSDWKHTETAMADLAQGTTADQPAAGDRLESWKEIAAYLKRDVRTVQRWEQREGLPVHRQQHDKLGSVYAYRSEIEHWRVRQRRTTPVTKNRALLRYAIAAILTVSATVIVGWLLLNRSGSPTRAIAVLPLENLSGDPAQDYLADGITDEITTALAKLGGLKIISRTSAVRYKGTHKSIREIASELKVGAVIEGSYQRSGDEIRVRIQLIRGATDEHLWAEQYDRKINDALTLEAEVARDIADHVLLQLSDKQRQMLAAAGPKNPNAFQDYLQGRHYWALRTREGLEKAIEYFQRAIQEDPTDARSYAGLAHCYIVLPFLTGMNMNEAFEKANDAANASLALDSTVPEAHLAKAEVLMYREWKLNAAEREFRRTLDLNPNYSTAHQWYGELLSLLGRHEEAIIEERAAVTLDPLSTIMHHDLAGILRDAGRFEEAIPEYRETIRMDPSFYAPYHEMFWGYRREGKLLESIQILEAGAEGWAREYKISPNVVPEVKRLRGALAQGGKPAYLRQCIKIHSYLGRPSFYLARDYAQLNDREAAYPAATRFSEPRPRKFVAACRPGGQRTAKRSPSSNADEPNCYQQQLVRKASDEHCR